MAEYVDGNEKAPLQSSAGGGGGGKRAPQKPDWTRFGLSGGDGQTGAGDGSTLTRNDEGAGEVNEIYAEHEVSHPAKPYSHCRSVFVSTSCNVK